jgi:hypothetical protein
MRFINQFYLTGMALRRPPASGAATGDGSKPVILVSKQI